MECCSDVSSMQHIFFLKSSPDVWFCQDYGPVCVCLCSLWTSFSLPVIMSFGFVPFLSPIILCLKTPVHAVRVCMFLNIFPSCVPCFLVNLKFRVCEFLVSSFHVSLLLWSGTGLMQSCLLVLQAFFFYLGLGLCFNMHFQLRHMCLFK